MPAKTRDLTNNFLGGLQAAATSRWVFLLIDVALLAALAALMAGWTWRFAELGGAPGKTLPATQDGETGLEALKSMHLFGKAEPGQWQEPTEAARTSLSVKLRGVFAAVGGVEAFAIIAIDGKDEAFSAGAQIMPGVILESVAADHVQLLNNGIPEKLELDSLGRTLDKLENTMSISANDINALLANAQNIGFELRQPPGGDRQLVLAKTTSEVEKIGLQNGDVLRTINGVKINNVEDLNRQLVSSAASQEITLSGERNGQSMNLTYKVQR